jgi:hypothetical protein
MIGWKKTLPRRRKRGCVKDAVFASGFELFK